MARPAYHDPLLAAQVIPSDAELDIQDAQIGRALRAFLARGVEEGWLEAPFDAAGTSAEQCVSALGALLGARDAAERGLREMRERLDLATVVDQALHLLETRIRSEEVEVALYLARPAWVRGDAIRLEQVLIRSHLEQTDADEALVLDSEGFITECCAANLFWRKGRDVFTPSLAQAGVNGIMRQFCLQQLAHAGFRVVESSSYYGKGYQDVEHRKPSIRNARRCLDWEPKIDMQETIDETLDFFLRTVELADNNKS